MCSVPLVKIPQKLHEAKTSGFSSSPDRLEDDQCEECLRIWARKVWKFLDDPESSLASWVPYRQTDSTHSSQLQ
eukprot:3912290-Amphidinium_carterae.1